jgi:uncharacterized protein YndB with AHSA1/START domain
VPDIMHQLKIHASPEAVYRAMTTAEGVRNWWTRDAALDTTIGGTGEFGFYERRFVIRVSVEELVPSARVGWKTIAGAPGWDGTTIAFALRPAEDGTLLAFAHRGFRVADERYASATTRWGYYLLSLKHYLEGGRGTPNPDGVDF